jgi:hypothetical protein
MLNLLVLLYLLVLLPFLVLLQPLVLLHLLVLLQLLLLLHLLVLLNGGLVDDGAGAHCYVVVLREHPACVCVCVFESVLTGSRTSKEHEIKIAKTRKFTTGPPAALQQLGGKPQVERHTTK